MSFPKKYEKNLPQGFTDTVDSMSTEELKSKILECEVHIYEIEKAKDEDEKLVQAREVVKEIAAPYKDAKNAESSKIKYVFYVAESRGVSLR